MNHAIIIIVEYHLQLNISNNIQRATERDARKTRSVLGRPNDGSVREFGLIISLATRSKRRGVERKSKRSNTVFLSSVLATSRQVDIPLSGVCPLSFQVERRKKLAVHPFSFHRRLKNKDRSFA